MTDFTEFDHIARSAGYAPADRSSVYTPAGRDVLERIADGAVYKFYLGPWRREAGRKGLVRRIRCVWIGPSCPPSFVDDTCHDVTEVPTNARADRIAAALTAWTADFEQDETK